MWQLVALLSTITSPMGFIRRVKKRQQNQPLPVGRPWAERPLYPTPYFGTPRGLERDIWHSKRKSLDIDVWESDRASLGEERIKMVPRQIEQRRRYILEKLDGGETLDITDDEIKGKEGVIKVAGGRRGGA
eukprot:GFKZ01002076.1.p2 GENE.GFKZ01002076.1~~GFKZ01002076.1.p2  ORF type:complete len:131 (+),score=18.73 GFKZ01002076.1:300-692(+)